MSARIGRLFSDYSEYHSTTGNHWCHMLGIPLIAFGSLGLLAIEVVRLDGMPLEVSLVLVLVLAPFYIRLHAMLGVAVTAAYFVMYPLARTLSWETALGLFAVGWAFQIVGHAVYEKRSPAFLTNLVHLMVGPLWVMNRIVRLYSPSPARPIPR